jgi:hypothetical protein
MCSRLCSLTVTVFPADAYVSVVVSSAMSEYRLGYLNGINQDCCINSSERDKDQNRQKITCILQFHLLYFAVFRAGRQKRRYLGDRAAGGVWSASGATPGARSHSSSASGHYDLPQPCPLYCLALCLTLAGAFSCFCFLPFVHSSYGSVHSSRSGMHDLVRRRWQAGPSCRHLVPVIITGYFYSMVVLGHARCLRHSRGTCYERRCACW